MRTTAGMISQMCNNNTIEENTTTELSKKTFNEKVVDTAVAVIEGAAFTGLPIMNGVMTNEELKHLDEHFPENGHKHMQADYEADRYSAINLFSLLYMAGKTAYCSYENWGHLNKTERSLIFLQFFASGIALFGSTFTFGESSNVKETIWIVPTVNALFASMNVYTNAKAAMKTRSGNYVTVESNATDGEKEKGADEESPVFRRG
jgi:hypothetical protein